MTWEVRWRGEHCFFYLETKHFSVEFYGGDQFNIHNKIEDNEYLTGDTEVLLDLLLALGHIATKMSEK